MRRMLGALVTASALFAGFSAGVLAQDYPTKPVKIVVPFAPGGGTDVYTRIIAEELGKSLGQRFLVENMPGAAGAIGTKAGIAAPNDGYTLVMGVASTIAVNPHTMGAEIGYDPLTELKPVSLVVYTPWIMVAATNAPFSDVDGLIAYGKANPGQLTFASWTSTGETGRKVFALRTGVEMLAVPYDGAVAAMNDIVAGRASTAMLDLSTALPFIRSGNMKALAVTGPLATDLMPGLPPISASGLDNMDINSWVAMFAPAGTPDAIIEKLNAEIRKIGLRDDVKARLAELGGEPYDWDVAAFDKFVREQHAIWKTTIAETTAK